MRNLKGGVNTRKEAEGERGEKNLVLVRLLLAGVRLCVPPCDLSLLALGGPVFVHACKGFYSAACSLPD